MKVVMFIDYFCDYSCAYVAFVYVHYMIMSGSQPLSQLGTSLLCLLFYLIYYAAVLI